MHIEKVFLYSVSRMHIYEHICNNFSQSLCIKKMENFLLRKSLNYKCQDCYVLSPFQLRCLSDYQGKQKFLIFHIKRAMHNKQTPLINIFVHKYVNFPKNFSFYFLDEVNSCIVNWEGFMTESNLVLLIGKSLSMRTEKLLESSKVETMKLSS